MGSYAIEKNMISSVAFVRSLVGHSHGLCDAEHGGINNFLYGVPSQRKAPHPAWTVREFQHALEAWSESASRQAINLAAAFDFEAFLGPYTRNVTGFASKKHCADSNGLEQHCSLHVMQIDGEKQPDGSTFAYCRWKYFPTDPVWFDRLADTNERLRILISCPVGAPPYLPPEPWPKEQARALVDKVYAGRRELNEKYQEMKTWFDKAPETMVEMMKLELPVFRPFRFGKVDSDGSLQMQAEQDSRVLPTALPVPVPVPAPAPAQAPGVENPLNTGGRRMRPKRSPAANRKRASATDQSRSLQKKPHTQLENEEAEIDDDINNVGEVVDNSTDLHKGQFCFCTVQEPDSENATVALAEILDVEFDRNGISSKFHVRWWTLSGSDSKAPNKATWSDWTEKIDRDTICFVLAPSEITLHKTTRAKEQFVDVSPAAALQFSFYSNKFNADES